MIEFFRRKYNSSNVRSKAVIKGASFSIAAMIIDSFARLLIVMILARCYTKNEFGIWATITSAAAIVVTGDLGITNALRNKISELIALDRENSKEQQKYFYSVMYLFLMIAVFFTICLLIFWKFLPIEYLFKTDDMLSKQMGVEILLFVQITFLFTIPLGIANSLYYSYQESHICAYINIAKAISTLVLIIILSLFNVSMLVLSISYFGIGLIFSSYSSWYFIIRRKWYSYKVSFKKAYKCNKELIMTGIKFMSLELSLSYLQNLGTILASSLLGVKIAADYNVATKIYTLLVSIVQSVFNPLWGAYADALNRGDIKWCVRTYRHSARYIIILFVAFTITCVFTGNFMLDILAGKGYSATWIMFALLGLNAMMFILYSTSSVVLKSVNKIKMLIIAVILSCILVIPFAKILIIYYGIYGLPISTAVIWLGLFVITHWINIKKIFAINGTNKY